MRHYQEISWPDLRYESKDFVITGSLIELAGPMPEELVARSQLEDTAKLYECAWSCFPSSAELHLVDYSTSSPISSR